MDTSGKFVLHMIGHGHIDPTWLWRWTEGYEEVRATFRSALDRMRETPDFRFTASSACFYQWVLESDPEMFAEIRGRVREGRWEPAGGMWVEPDCNLPAGESFVRHFLYSQRFFLREFGRIATTGFNPDSFGHAGTLPQLLAKAGIENYVYMRPSPVHEMDYPGGNTFWWEAPDGSRVLAANIPECYNAVGEELRKRMETLPAYPHLLPGQRRTMCFFGVGNHGGGPTKEAIAHIQGVMAADGETAPQFSTLGEYFTALRAEFDAAAFPVIANELQHHARGCYSVVSEMKRLNRAVEHALMTAERFATAAWLLEAIPYPSGQFELAWKDLLYNQFHDILAGTSLASSYADTRDQLGAARHRADVIRNMAVQALARGVDTTAEGNTLIVVNPLAWPVECTVAAPPIAARALGASRGLLDNTVPGLHLVDDAEIPVPVQAVRGERIDHVRHAFTAQLPAMGYRLYHLRAGAPASKPAHPRPLEASRCHMENTWWRIEFDPSTGEISRLFDKIRHTEVLRRGNILAALADQSDTWSHGVTEWRVEAGRFGGARIDVAEPAGAVLATVRSVSSWNKSAAIMETTLYRDTDVIDCFLRVNWQEQYTLLKLVWETAVTGGTATYETPYGHQVRPADGGEEPGLQWFDWSGVSGAHPCGLAVANDGKYGYDARDGVMRLTVLRSPAYAHHDNGRFTADAHWPIIDQGWQELRFRLIPHGGDWRAARVPKRAWELNAPAFIHCESAHPGTRPPQASLLGTEAGNVLLSVIKMSEEGGDIIIRGHETDGLPAETRLHLPHFDRYFDLSFAPHEVKTVRISPKTWEMRETNLLEE